MSRKPNESNVVLDAALNWQFPAFFEEKGLQRVVAFGDHSHKCPVYVRQTPPCTSGCPAGNDIRAWLTTVQQTELKERTFEESCELAWHEASKTTPFPAVCGRVCPHPCETHCNRNEKEQTGVNIGCFERFIGDYGIRHGLAHRKLRQEVMGKKVAVIGAGPAGLSCAFQMARRGYPVAVFEAFAEPGGMMRYGIPPYRLPKDILKAEIDAIVRMGVDIRCNTAVGRDVSLAELRAEYDAVFIGIGAHVGRRLNVEGEDAPNVFSAVSFLKRINSGETVELGSHLVVIGGGHTALVIARLARRMGVQVTVLYRRTINEMPATSEEVEEATAEDVSIRYLIAPVGIRTENDRAVAVQCLRTELGELDESGRGKPILIEGTDVEVECSSMILAISQHPDWKDMEHYVQEHGWYRVNEDYTVDEGVYAGGDVVNPDRVTTAIGHGRMAAERMDAWLEERRFQPSVGPGPILAENLRLDYYEELACSDRRWMPLEDRFDGTIELEIDLGISEEQFRAEAERCMSCGLCFACRQCLIFCPQQAIVEFPENPPGEVMYTHYTKCVGCHICSLVCPCGYIHMGMADDL